MPNNMSRNQRRIYELFFFGVRFLGLYATVPLIFNRLFVTSSTHDYRNDSLDTLSTTALEGLAQLTHAVGANTLTAVSSCALLLQFPGAFRQGLRAGESLAPSPVARTRPPVRYLSPDIEAPSPSSGTQLTPRRSTNAPKLS